MLSSAQPILSIVPEERSIELASGRSRASLPRATVSHNPLPIAFLEMRERRRKSRKGLVAKVLQTVWKPRLRIPVDLGVWYVSAMAHLAGTDRSQLVLLPEAVDDYVGPDNPVRFIEALVDGLDLGTAGFVRVQPKATGRPGYDPDDLLKLYIYG